MQTIERKGYFETIWSAANRNVNDHLKKGKGSKNSFDYSVGETYK